MGNTSFIVTSVTITSNSPPTVSLQYSSSDGDVTEYSAGTVTYSLASSLQPLWSIVGLVTADQDSDITWTVNNGTLTITDEDTNTSETFSFLIQVSNGTTTYNSADPEIINKPKPPM